MEHITLSSGDEKMTSNKYVEILTE